ncbi:MAG TPA: glycoside hydrolase family 2 TIM barrel-domain containing protein [Candidatus Dormibacteraeota bacterium]|nr:glycoside hydrolase family 2 TIM barrel-domain containing protein [Candidatus Dormibacteraeota bacterium]
MQAKNEKEPQLLLNRRDLLKGAAGAAALVSVYPWGDSVFAESQIQNPTGRVRESFDFGWKFQLGDFPGAHVPEFSDSYWNKIDLPHDWSIDGPFDEHAPSGFCGGYLPTGIGWYRKRFHLPASLQDQNLTIEFDGVYENSEVWINGRSLGKRPYGYVSFYYDLTLYVALGQENVIAVRVDNSRQTNCRWYSGSGIYRHTWLLSTNKIHVAQWGTFVRSTAVSKDRASVQISTWIRNDGSHPATCALKTTLRDSDGNPVQDAESSQDIPAGGQHEFQQEISLSAPQLWSVVSPYLYSVHSAVSTNNQTVDEYATSLGIRNAVFDADQGFLLNGERVKLKGVCLHHDGGCVGAAVPERIWERRLEILREMGCNAIRTAHNAPAPEFLDLCDRMGFLVMDEAFDEWRVPKGQIGPNGYSNYFEEWYERDVQNFVRRDRNHPSVVLWSAGNEVGDQQSPQGAETLAKLLKVFRAEDPTRLVTVGCDHIRSEPPSEAALPGFLALLDVVGYNYADRWRDRREKYYSLDRHTFPQRRFIGTESESMGNIRGDYRYLFPGDPASEEIFLQPLCAKNIDVEQLFRFVTTYDYVAGDFMWTGIDHLGEARWPMKGSATGVIDTCGFKKDGFFFYQSQWIDKPVLHVFPHWNWKGKEGQTIPVTCYTNCDTVELFLNGRSLGTKGYAFPRLGMELRYANYPARARAPRTTADLHLSWDVPYEPGTLRAVGTKDGKVAATVEIPTTGEPAAIRLTPDRQTISSDRGGIAHVKVEIADAQGRVVPTANSEVTFDVQGPGKLLGVDSGDPHSHEDYRSNRRRAFNGLCFAILQATGNPGEIRLKATSPSLQAAGLIVRVTS